MAENSSLVAGSFLWSSRGGLAYTQGPGAVRRWWRTPWQDCKTVKPQENHRVMILVPLETIGEPSAVRRQTLLEEADLISGNTETEARESTKNSWLPRMSCRNSKEKLHCSWTGSGSGSGTGYDNSSEKPAGWKGSSTCQTASFSTPSRVSYSSELYLHVSLLQ